ncbi:MAG: hypothetical protein AVDCRST_MAG32-102, partial [uncultured Nocardioides sp.]
GRSRGCRPARAVGRLRDRGVLVCPRVGEVVRARTVVGHGLGPEPRLPPGAGRARLHRDRPDRGGPRPRDHAVHRARAL